MFRLMLRIAKAMTTMMMIANNMLQTRVQRGHVLLALFSLILSNRGYSVFVIGPKIWKRRKSGIYGIYFSCFLKIKCVDVRRYRNAKMPINKQLQLFIHFQKEK